MAAKDTHFKERKATFGVFRQKTEVKAALRALKASGFSQSAISVLYPLHRGPRDFPHRQKTTILTGASIGAVFGGLIFLILGVLVNLRTVPVPSLQETAGLPNPLSLVLGICLGGIILGAAAGALVGIGTPQRAGERYGDYVDAGGILMSVHVETSEQDHMAKAILDKAGAQDIHLLNEGRDWETVYAKVVKESHEHRV